MQLNEQDMIELGQDLITQSRALSLTKTKLSCADKKCECVLVEMFEISGQVGLENK